MIPAHGYDEGQAFLAVFCGWVTAQAIKIFIGMIRERRFDFRWLIGTGGMPSTHSAAVASLSTVVGYYYGFGSIPFAMSLVFSLIIMFDAAGVRRAAGRQASVLNKILDELYEKGEIPEERLKELLGHTPVQVFAGAAVGIVVAVLMR